MNNFSILSIDEVKEIYNKLNPNTLYAMVNPSFRTTKWGYEKEGIIYFIATNIETKERQIWKLDTNTGIVKRFVSELSSLVEAKLKLAEILECKVCQL